MPHCADKAGSQFGFWILPRKEYEEENKPKSIDNPDVSIFGERASERSNPALAAVLSLNRSSSIMKRFKAMIS